MNEEFVPYEEAKDLKKLGFNEPCIGVYGYNALSKSLPDNLIDKTIITYIQEIIKKEKFDLTPNDLKNSNIGEDISTPTYSQAFKWLRKEHDLDYAIIPDPSSQYKELLRSYSVSIFRYSNGVNVQAEILRVNEKIVTFNKRENAELACLKKMIEVVNLNRKSTSENSGGIIKQI